MLMLWIVAASCIPTKWQNVTKEPWTDYDKSVYTQTLKRCPELYGKDFKYVSLFRKYKPLQYTVICCSMNTGETNDH